MNHAARIAVAVAMTLLVVGCSRKDAPARADSQQASKPPAEPATMETGRQHGTSVNNQQVQYAEDRSGEHSKLSPLDQDLLGRFQALNPAVTRAHVFSIMSTVSGDDLGQYVAVANGRTPNMTHPDRFTNFAHAEDIFGVFLVNHELTKVNRRIGLFISPRLGDYRAWIVRISSDSVVVCGIGDSYGDSRARWSFAIDSARAARSARTRDSIEKNQQPPSSINDEADGPFAPPPDCPKVDAN